MVKITIIDDRTDAGIMRFMGKARAAIEGTLPLVGKSLGKTLPLAIIAGSGRTAETQHLEHMVQMIYWLIIATSTVKNCW